MSKKNANDINQADQGSYVVNLGHNQYIHIKDRATNITR